MDCYIKSRRRSLFSMAKAVNNRLGCPPEWSKFWWNRGIIATSMVDTRMRANEKMHL
jgi:hypothetical protein